VYHGQVILSTRSGGAHEEMAIPVALRVLAFAQVDSGRHDLSYTLPQPEGYFIGEYYRPWGYTTDDAWKAGVSADLADMRDHGMTTVGLCFGLDTAKAVFQDHAFDLGLDGTTRFEHFMDTYVALGFAAPIVILSDSGQGAASKVADYGTPEYDVAYKAFWTTVQQTCRDRGWPELIVQPVDEPGWKDKTAQERNTRLLKLLKEIPGMRTEQDGPGDGYFRNVAGPWADLWNYNGSIEAFDKIRAIRQDHLVMFYNNDVESYRPEVDRYVAGFFQKAADIDGVFNWEYRGGRGSLYNDQDGPSGDWVHNYPAAEESKGGPSLAWEAAREGVDDLRYLVAFEFWRDQASSLCGLAPHLPDARERHAYLIESIKAMPGVRGRAQWTEHWTPAEAARLGRAHDPEADGYVGGFLKHPNGWTLADYQRARWLLACNTLELMQDMPGVTIIDAPPEPASLGQPEMALLGCVTYPREKLDTPEGAVASTEALIIPELSAAPELDGQFDEPAWHEAYRIEGFVPNTGTGTLEAQTRALVGWHGEYLYIAVDCEEPNMGGLVADCLEDGENTWMDDCIEIFFDPGVSLSRYAHLAFNAKGVQWSKSISGFPWEERVPVGAACGERAWSIEVAVSLAEVLQAGADLGFNVCRERRAGAQLELSCWRPTGGRFAMPTKFAHVRLANAPKNIAVAAPGAQSHLKLRRSDAFAFVNDRLSIDFEWTGEPALLEQGRLRFDLLFAEGSSVQAELEPPVPLRATVILGVENAPPGQGWLGLELVGETGRILDTASAPCWVLPPVVD